VRERQRPNDSATAPLELWLDGDCDLCRRAGAWVEARASGRPVSLRDQRDGLPAEIADRTDAREQLWVRRADGRLVGGFAACLELLGRLPRWRRLAWLLARPPLCWLGPPLYRSLAQRRARISRAVSSRRPEPLRRA
jgi:predicted DCC family thiol-disulfide oxidoreductase YuxK